jgi:hypothetical protein
MEYFFMAKKITGAAYVFVHACVIVNPCDDAQVENGEQSSHNFLLPVFPVASEPSSSLQLSRKLHGTTVQNSMQIDNMNLNSFNDRKVIHYICDSQQKKPARADSFYVSIDE